MCWNCVIWIRQNKKCQNNFACEVANFLGSQIKGFNSNDGLFLALHKYFFVCVQNDENQNEIVMALLEDIITEVISSNQKKPSVPGIILETIIDMVNGVIDVEAVVPSEQSSAVSSDVLESVAFSIVAEIVDEVIQSNNRQPSVSGVVLQLITEMITNSDSNNNRERKSTTTTKDGKIGQQKQSTGDEKVKKLEPSESQKHNDAVRSEFMRQVCNLLEK